MRFLGIGVLLECRGMWGIFCFSICLRSEVLVCVCLLVLHVDRGGIPANNFWPFVDDNNGLRKGVSVLERVHSNSAYDFSFYYVLH